MEIGATVVVQARESAGHGWSATRVARFVYSAEGMVDAGPVDR